MFYRYSLTVPAGTSQRAPVREMMMLSYGIVHQVEIGFPPGCAGLVHASIWHYEHQAWPTNPDQQFAADNYNVRILNEHYELLNAPFLMTFRGWSQDAIYQHTIVCRIGIKIPEPHRPGSWIRHLLSPEQPD